MRVHVLSDLHMERAPFELPATEADVLVLAGDIGSGVRGVRWAAQLPGAAPVLYLAGNHEFYGHSLPTLTDQLRAAAAGSRVRVLENDQVLIGGVRFLGCTLWSDFDFGGQAERAAAMEFCARVVNDYTHIDFAPQQRVLKPHDTRMLHIASRRWLEHKLAEPHAGPTVVLTHHAPVIRGRPAQAHLRALAGAFVSDLTSLMGADRVALWIYGHTHRVADLDVAGTRVVSNPRGYPHEPVRGFDPSLVVELADNSHRR
jgi:predicted phosphodiesterase